MIMLSMSHNRLANLLQWLLLFSTILSATLAQSDELKCPKFPGGEYLFSVLEPTGLEDFSPILNIKKENITIRGKHTILKKPNVVLKPISFQEGIAKFNLSGDATNLESYCHAKWEILIDAHQYKRKIESICCFPNLPFDVKLEPKSHVRTTLFYAYPSQVILNHKGKGSTKIISGVETPARAFVEKIMEWDVSSDEGSEKADVSPNRGESSKIGKEVEIEVKNITDGILLKFKSTSESETHHADVHVYGKDHKTIELFGRIIAERGGIPFFNGETRVQFEISGEHKIKIKNVRVDSDTGMFKFNIPSEYSILKEVEVTITVSLAKASIFQGKDEISTLRDWLTGVYVISLKEKETDS